MLGSAVQGGAAGRVRTRRNDKAAGAEWFLPSVNDRPATCGIDARLWASLDPAMLDDMALAFAGALLLEMETIGLAYTTDAEMEHG